MPFSHIKAFLKKRTESQTPHSSDWVTSSDVNGNKRALDVKDASLETHVSRVLLECILDELKLVNTNLSLIVDEEINLDEIRKD